MLVKLHFNWKDVPRALRFGFSLKKIWVQFLGLLIGHNRVFHICLSGTSCLRFIF